ncbi:putative gustatory receptor 2a [Anopheles moucheti]|uniref:putative gustatory receptor 2a n=1 Tax=Anopheles moucheti TaxID=186751 RepID=UPI0022F03D5B|nr:putative gustatory receptor 2a [Anopheles moucheti]
MNLVLPLLPTERQLLCVAFAIFKLFGFIPFPFDCYTFELKPCSTKRTLLHLPLGQLLFYVIAHCTVMLRSADIFYTELQILNFNDILKYGSLVMAVFVIFICTIVQRNTHRSIWDMLRHLRGTTRKEYVQRYTRQYLWKFYGYLLFSAIVEALELYSIHNSPPDLAYWLMTLNLSAFLRFRHLFHMFYINLLKIQFKQLQYGLVDVSSYMGNLRAHPKGSKLYRELYNRCVDRLLELKNVYGQLWELSDSINRTFGCPQICNFSGNFVQLSCDLYWCYMTAKGYGVGDYQDFMFITLLPTSCLIVLLLSSAEACLRVTSSLQSTLLEIPHENNPTFRKIVYRFGLQIAQQKIRLTAYGLFEINYSLLRMFATGITTYMIIFITFSKELTPAEVSDD